MKGKKTLLYALLLAMVIVPSTYTRVIKAEEKKIRIMHNQSGEVQRKVEFENDRIMVIRYRFAPHAKVPIHDAPDLLAIWLTDGRLKMTFPDGTSKLEIHKRGETEWTPAQKHAGENLADTPLEFIAVQMK